MEGEKQRTLRSTDNESTGGLHLKREGIEGSAQARAARMNFRTGRERGLTW